MAKLSEGNLAKKKDAQISKVDDWNPPIVAPSAAAQMLPPKSRPLPRIPTTPSGNSQTKSTNSELQTSSSRKKRRRRGGKRNGDSASEVTTNISEDTSHNPVSPTQNASKVLVPASQSSLHQLPPNISAEQRRIFENEPELFGVFASSDEEDQAGKKQTIEFLPRRARPQTYSPSVANGPAASSPVKYRRETGVASLRAEPARPQIGSDAGAVGVVKMPNPRKLSDGRFECPLKDQYDCTKTFKDARTARRHAGLHINAGWFKCEKCGKGFSRQDRLVSHMRTCDKEKGTTKHTEAAQAKNVQAVHAEGAVEIEKAKGGEMAADVSNADLSHIVNTSDDEEVSETEHEDSAEDAGVKGASASVRETDEEEQLDTNHGTERHDSQLNVGGRNGVGKENLTAQSITESVTTSLTARTASPSSQRAFVPVEKQSSAVNGTSKRKRPSPRSSREFDVLPSRKRVRRDRDKNLHSSPNSRQVDVTKEKIANTQSVKSPGFADHKALWVMDVAMNDQGDQDTNEPSESEEIIESDVDPALGADVEMQDDLEVQESDDESDLGLEDQAARSPNPIPEDVDVNDFESAAADGTNDETTDSTSAEETQDDEENEATEAEMAENGMEVKDVEVKKYENEDHEKDEEASSDSDDEADSEPPQNRTETSNEVAPTVRRRLSMDSFVQRSKATATSAVASSSHPKVSVNVPVYSTIQTKKAQSKLSSKEQVEPHKSTEITGVPPAEDSEIDESTERNRSEADIKGKSRAVNRGQGKARAMDVKSQNAFKETEEKTSSEDHPRATTVARRSSSLGSKSKPRLKNRTIPKRKTKPTSDSDESEQMEKPKSKPKRPPKKKPKVSTGEESEEDEKAVRKKAKSIAKSTWAEASTSGVTGRFTEDETQTLNAWRDSFCEENNLTAWEFNEMMMNTASITKADWKYGWITKSEFMQQYYEQLPERNRRSMIRFRERQFHNADTTSWTEDHDKELRQLVAERGTKWVEIAQIMGRTQDAVNQRWRHKLNYGEKPALMGDWTTEEVQRLEDEVTAFARTKNTTPDDEDLQIPWLAISKKMGNGRTAQQCSNRWRINTSRRINGKFVKVPHSDRLPGTKVKKPRTPSKMEKRLSGQAAAKSNKMYKSAEKVEDSEGEDDNDEEDEEEEEEAGEDEKAQVGEGAEEDRDADDESNDAQDDEEPEGDDEQKDMDENDANLQTASHDDDEQEESEEDFASGSADVKMTSRLDQPQSAWKDTAQNSQSVAARLLSTSTQTTKSSSAKGYPFSQHASSSQPILRSTPPTSHSQSLSTQLHSLPSSSQPPSFKTPAMSKNPLKRASRNHSSPALDLSLSQIHAATQANSSAKRTTGRTNRTRVLDSARTEARPSPGLSIRRRPVRSSSPLLSPLLDGAREDEEDQDSERGELDFDFKSPTSFVSARDTLRLVDSDEDDDQDRDENGQSETDSRSESDSGSGSTSSSSSDSDSESESRSNQPSTFWQSVNQNFKRLTGLSQSQSQNGSDRGSGPSQSQSKGQSQSQSQKRSRSGLSLVNALRRGSMDEEEEEEESDDD